MPHYRALWRKLYTNLSASFLPSIAVVEGKPPATVALQANSKAAQHKNILCNKPSGLIATAVAIVIFNNKLTIATAVAIVILLTN